MSTELFDAEKEAAIIKAHDDYMIGFYQFGYLQALIEILRPHCIPRPFGGPWRSLIDSLTEDQIACGRGNAFNDLRAGEFVVRLWDVPEMLRPTVARICERAGIHAASSSEERGQLLARLGIAA